MAKLLQASSSLPRHAALGAGLCLLLMPIALIVFRNRSEDVGKSMDGLAETHPLYGSHARATGPSRDFTLSQALRTRSFWIVAAGTAWFGLVHTAVFFSLVPILSDRALTEQHAATLMASFAISLAVIHLIGGILADRSPASMLLSLGMASFGVSLACLYSLRTGLMVIMCGVLMGMLQGLYFGASQPLWARYCGRLNLGMIRGALMTVNVAASSLGPLVAGLVRDRTGSFDWAILTFAAVSFPLAVVSMFAKPPAISGKHRTPES